MEALWRTISQLLSPLVTNRGPDDVFERITCGRTIMNDNRHQLSWWETCCQMDVVSRNVGLGDADLSHLNRRTKSCRVTLVMPYRGPSKTYCGEAFHDVKDTSLVPGKNVLSASQATVNRFLDIPTMERCITPKLLNPSHPPCIAVPPLLWSFFLRLPLLSWQGSRASSPLVSSSGFPLRSPR